MRLTKMRKEIESIKRDAKINLERDDYVAALNRQLARFGLIPNEDFFPKKKAIERRMAMNKDYDVCRPPTEDREFSIDESNTKARALLEEDTFEKWRADQITIEKYHLQNYGHLNYLVNLPACGGTKREMVAQLEKWDEHRFQEWQRRKKERRQTREALEKDCGLPVRLHPIREHVDPESMPLKYRPQFRDGAIGHEFQELYPWNDFREYDGTSTVVLDPNWSEDENQYSPKNTSPLHRYYEIHTAKVAELKLQWHRRDLRGQTIWPILYISVPGLVELVQ